jgi:glucosamine--fructose-6-phosphate aminotransferase (isomerizing)
MNPMLEQIYSLPGMIREIFQPFDDSVRENLDFNLCLSLKRLYVTGCGDSHHAAVGTHLAFEALAGIPTEAQTALEFARYTAPFLPKTGPGTNVVIGISVSGEVSRTLEALIQGKANGATTISLCGTPGSRIFNASDYVINSQSPVFPEPAGIHVPGVRSFTSNQVALLLAAIRIGEVRGVLVTSEANALRKELLNIADAVERTISSCDGAALSLAQEWADAGEFVFVGGGPNYATAMFSAAKVLEASGDPAMAQETEEWAHLQYFARATATPTFLITAGDRDRSRMEEVATAARAVGRRVVAIAPASLSPLQETANKMLPLPEGVREMYSPLVASIPGELFAAYRAELLGEPYFRGFSGGRSQEGGGGISRIRTSELLGS